MRSSYNSYLILYQSELSFYVCDWICCIYDYQLLLTQGSISMSAIMITSVLLKLNESMPTMPDLAIAMANSKTSVCISDETAIILCSCIPSKLSFSFW
jgi:hypothetical protein